MSNETKPIQFVHDSSIDTESQITMFIHCGKCLKERPEGITPREWARTQTGFTANGFQVWCTRHDVNIDNVEVRLAPTAPRPSPERSDARSEDSE